MNADDCKRNIERAISTISLQGDTPILQGAFVELYTFVYFQYGNEMARSAEPKTSSVSPLLRILRKLRPNLERIFYISDKLTWENSLWNVGTLNNREYSIYTSLDIKLFLIRY